MANKRCGEVVLADDKDLKELKQNPVQRFLGLSLGGAKSNRTSLTVIDFYKKQEKLFVLDTYEEIGPVEPLSADQVLCDLIREVSIDIAPEILSVDVPLTFPPCLFECDVTCQSVEKCKKPEVRWMRACALRSKVKSKNRKSKLKLFTPYSQRPIDLFFRQEYSDENLFQDETMGANLAPQAARMAYLQRQIPFQEVKTIEVWPKFVIFALQKQLKLTKTEALNYRNIEKGSAIRAKILERMAEKFKIFIYERDQKKLISNTVTFDSYILAWMSFLYYQGMVLKPKSDFPKESGWVEIPEC